MKAARNQARFTMQKVEPHNKIQPSTSHTHPHRHTRFMRQALQLRLSPSW
jgi:hypothetical protein